MTDATSTPYRRFGRETLSAVTIALFATPALIFSVFLTVLKFRTEYRCDSFSLNTCSSGCSIALSDSLSTFWDLPLTVYSAGFYFALLLAAIAVGVWPRAMTPLARLPVLVLGASGLAVSVLLGSYAALVLGTWCEFCTVLYIASLGVYLAARLLNPEGLIRGLVRGLRRMTGNHIIIAAVLFSAFFAVVLVQKRILGRQAAEAIQTMRQSTSMTCEEHRLTVLPATPFKLKSDRSPEVTVAMFFDLACPHCKKDFEFWRDYQRAHADFLRVEFFHFSGDPACGGPFDSPGLKQHSSCLGALALQCLDELEPGRAIEHMEEMFAMQDGQQPSYFSEERLTAMAERHQLPGLMACVRDPARTRQITAHIKFGVHHGLKSPPSTLIVPMVQRGWETRPSGFAAAVLGGGKSLSWIDAQMDLARARRNQR